MKQIDWSKKPEGYPLWLKDLNPDEGGDMSGWHRDDGDKYTDESGLHWKKCNPDDYIVYSEPQKSWTGEGLPPVGTVCELKVRLLLASEYDSKWLEEGDLVEVGGHALFSGAEGSVCSVCAIGSNYTGTVIHEMLQPIRTPEQIADDKRLHEVRNALTTIKAGQSFPGDLVRGNIVLATVEAMIDAGYQKVEVQP